MTFYRILAEGESILPGDEYLSKPNTQEWAVITSDYLSSIDEKNRFVPAKDSTCSPIRRMIDMVKLNPDNPEHQPLIEKSGELWGVMWRDGADKVAIVDADMKITSTVLLKDVRYLNACQMQATNTLN